MDYWRLNVKLVIGGRGGQLLYCPCLRGSLYESWCPKYALPVRHGQYNKQTIQLGDAAREARAVQ